MEKEYAKAVYCHPAYLTYMQCTSGKMLGWMKHKLGIRIAGRNINNLRYTDVTTLMVESEELKNLLIRVQEESKTAGLKLNIQKSKIMASRPIMSCQIGGEKVEYFLFLGSKITADGDCRHEIKRRLFFGRKAMTNLDSILKSRHRFANKGLYSQNYGFSSSPCTGVRVGP